MVEAFGRYELVERLGFGGMAEVFLARTAGVAGFEKQLAIKRLLPYCTEDEQTVALLADEARITVKLTHPNIVQVFDFGEINGSYFIAMEYVDGVDLKTLIQIDEDSSRPLPPDVALHTVICLLEGLDFAHKRRDENGEEMGIIHRDVSPHNVLISRHGHVKLTDFGVARARISIHVSVVGDIRGKFSYMPPEQACGGEIDQRVDIFAVGAILYELLSGHQPFRSTSTGEQMKLLNAAVVPPSSLVAGLPTGLDAITLRALAKDPAARYETAADFATDLKRQLKMMGQADPLLCQQKLAELVESRFAEAEREAPEVDERSQMRSLAELDHGYQDSLIFPDQAEQQAVHGELRATPSEDYNLEALRGQPSVDFSEALLEEAALIASRDSSPGRGEDRTEVVLRREANDNPLAFAKTALALRPVDLGLSAVDSEADRTQIHQTLDEHDYYGDDLHQPEDDPTDVGAPHGGAPLHADDLELSTTDQQQRIELAPPRRRGFGTNSAEVKTSIHLVRDFEGPPRDDYGASLGPSEVPTDGFDTHEQPAYDEHLDGPYDLRDAPPRESSPFDTYDDSAAYPRHEDEPDVGRYSVGRTVGQPVIEARRDQRSDPAAASRPRRTGPPAADLRAHRGKAGHDDAERRNDEREPAFDPETAEARLPAVEPRSERNWIGWVGLAMAVVVGVIIAVVVATC